MPRTRIAKAVAVVSLVVTAALATPAVPSAYGTDAAELSSVVTADAGWQAAPTDAGWQ
ncbi:hypothetical protein ACWD3I_47465 [Streptomyces sp. NPDC002817]|uniref:hypothetical protein n=1 Tax=Streptomyces sp. NPDC088357 TaxID=3154655 RepID=UPI00343CB785